MRLLVTAAAPALICPEKLIHRKLLPKTTNRAEFDMSAYVTVQTLETNDSAATTFSLWACGRRAAVGGLADPRWSSDRGTIGKALERRFVGVYSADPTKF
jgi:hypothetical protein